MTQDSPFVRLTRLQSGVGALTVTAMCSPAVGDVRLGVAYRLADGKVGVLRRTADGPAHAPTGNARPLMALTQHQFQTLTIDLRQVRQLETLLVFGYPGDNATGPEQVVTADSGPGYQVAQIGPGGRLLAPPAGSQQAPQMSRGSTLNWAGTLTVVTSAGAKAEIPLDAPPSPGVMPLATIRQVDGWLFVRAERLWPLATVRDLSTEWGFADELTWLDPNTPAT